MAVDPLSGTWEGEWGPTTNRQTRVTVEFKWDGTTLHGRVNPEGDGYEFSKASFDSKTGEVRMELDGPNTRNEVVHYKIVGKLSGGHLCVDGNTLARNGIEGIFADRLEKRVRQIDALDVAAAKPAEIADTNAVKNRADAGILIDDVAHGRRTDEETVVVVMEAAVVFVVGDEKFGGVAREK